MVWSKYFAAHWSKCIIPSEHYGDVIWSTMDMWFGTEFCEYLCMEHQNAMLFPGVMIHFSNKNTQTLPSSEAAPE